jgi:hypothetical protein
MTVTMIVRFEMPVGRRSTYIRLSIPGLMDFLVTSYGNRINSEISVVINMIAK